MSLSGELSGKVDTTEGRQYLGTHQAPPDSQAILHKEAPSQYTRYIGESSPLSCVARGSLLSTRIANGYRYRGKKDIKYALESLDDHDQHVRGTFFPVASGLSFQFSEAYARSIIANSLASDAMKPRLIPPRTSLILGCSPRKSRCTNHKRLVQGG